MLGGGSGSRPASRLELLPLQRKTVNSRNVSAEHFGGLRRAHQERSASSSEAKMLDLLMNSIGESQFSSLCLYERPDDECDGGSRSVCLLRQNLGT